MGFDQHHANFHAADGFGRDDAESAQKTQENLKIEEADRVRRGMLVLFNGGRRLA